MHTISRLQGSEIHDCILTELLLVHLADFISFNDFCTTVTNEDHALLTAS